MDLLPVGLFAVVAAASTLAIARDRKRDGGRDDAAATAADVVADAPATTSSSSRVVRYRWATASDRPRIARLVLRNHLDLSWDRPEEWIRQVLDVPSDFPHLLRPDLFARGMYRVAVVDHPNDEIIVGCAGVTPSSRGAVVVPPSATEDGDDDDGRCADGTVDSGDCSRYDLTSVSVTEDWRRRGIAEKLTASVLRRTLAELPDVETIALVTLKEASSGKKLYEKIGFRLIREEVIAELPRRMTVLEYELSLKKFVG